MRRKFAKAITSWLIEKLEASDKFRAIIREIIEEFYLKNSLHKHRVWGDSSRLSIGDNVQLNNAIINTVSGKVIVGRHTFLGHNVCLLTGTHDYRITGLARQSSVPASGRDIVIGEGVWVASNATVIGPCEIGDNTVVGACSVITGKIPPNSVYAGTPAKFVRQI